MVFAGNIGEKLISGFLNKSSKSSLCSFEVGRVISLVISLVSLAFVSCANVSRSISSSGIDSGIAFFWSSGNKVVALSVRLLSPYSIIDW